MESGSARARLLLVRHGITGWNLEGRYTSTSDIALHPTARGALAQTAQTLAERRIRRVISSPMQRAVATAQILRDLGAFRGSIEVMDDLRELDFGHFEGRSRREMLDGRLADVYADWMRVHDGFPSPPGGEEWTSASARASRVLRGVAERGETTLVVSHGYLLRILVVTAVRRLPVNAIRTMPLANGSITELSYDESDGWSLVAHNEHGVFASDSEVQGTRPPVE